ncbi:MAG TPA: hypothetical protein VK783_07335, partial [Bacteroidia bacterium]|nr:hypothetical protein [Bacteroidia bacterium]
MSKQNFNWAEHISIKNIYNESQIKNYRELYLRNKDINKFELKNILNELTALKDNITFIEDENNATLAAIDKKLKKLVHDGSFISEYGKITKKHLITQKEIAFDKNNPPFEGDAVMQLMSEMFRVSKRERECEISAKEFKNSAIPHRVKTLSLLIECIENYGVHELINSRVEGNALYNIYLHFINYRKKEKKDSRILLKKEELFEQYVDPYLNKQNIMFDGIQIEHKDIIAIRVSKGLYNKEEAPLFFQKANFGMESLYEDKADSRIKYFQLCENVTEKFINTKSAKINRGSHDYVFQDRLSELEGISNINFDLTKLIQLCRELNAVNEKGLFYSKAALVRAICDHIPPIFEFNSFENVAANYKADKNTKSFKGAVKGLNDFFKHVADG